MKRKSCPSCKTRPIQKHFNSKWCLSCALDRRKRPKSTLTAEQKAFVREMRGKMSGREMAKELGVSWSNVMRFARDRRMSLATLTGARKYRINPALVRQVTKYYEKHGRTATEKAFPTVKIRSIVERYKNFSPRQTRWTNEQIILAAKMAGLVDGKRQARIFNRPGANEGSIKSLWMKRFGQGGGNIHGMSEWMARELLKPGYPVLKTRMWSPRKGVESNFERGIVLWVDMERRVRPDIPKFIHDAITTLADFQRWLFKSKNPKPVILRMIRESKMHNGRDARRVARPPS